MAKTQNFPIQHVGINEHRLMRSDAISEKEFAKLWNEIATDTLPYILYGPHAEHHALTQDDASKAASLIQWLGTPVGSIFLNQAFDRIKKAQEIKNGSKRNY